MGYTIKDFVESNHFKGLKLINQTGLDREIRGTRIIAVTDMVLNRKLYPSDDCKLYYPI